MDFINGLTNFSQMTLLSASISHYFKPPEFFFDPLTQKIAMVIFALAILHTFMVGQFAKLSHHFKHDSISYKFCHLLAEVEAVFGIWALLLIFILAGMHGKVAVFDYLKHTVDFTEPAMVFVIMTIASTLPIIYFANRVISSIAKALPINPRASFYFSCMVIGPILGSFITEPAAITVTAIILKNAFYDKGMSRGFMYTTLAVLFVNISIGGTLTHFAAPPVLMVSKAWNWDMPYMLTNFGWKAIIAVFINALITTFMYRKELCENSLQTENKVEVKKIKIFVVVIQLVFLAAVVVFAHDLVIFLGIFIIFLGWCEITSSYQDPLKIKSALLVGFFLAGLVIIGKMQAWWLKPLIGMVNDWQLFIGTSLLTAITDNAALTFLGTTVDGMSLEMKYSLVAGAVAGGGLTVIANAPNPAGFGILKGAFEKEGFSAAQLFKSAILPTIIAMLCFWFLGTPKESKNEGQAKSILIQVNTHEKFTIENKQYDFIALKEYLENSAKNSEGKLKLVLMLSSDTRNKEEKVLTLDDLERVFSKMYSIEAKEINSGQLILDYQLK